MHNDDESLGDPNTMLASTELESSVSTGRPRRSKLKCSHEGCTFEVGHRLLMERHVLDAHDDSPPPPDENPMRKHRCSRNGCNKRFLSSSHLRRHQSVHDKEKPIFQCHVSDCAQKFFTNSALHRHQQTDHRNEWKHQLRPDADAQSARKFPKIGFVCAIPGCPRRFTAPYYLRRHQQFHNRIAKQDECYVHVCRHAGCTKRYADARRLRMHQLIHDDAARKRCPCPYKGCGWAFTYPSKLRRHLNGHKNSPHRMIPAVKCDPDPLEDEDSSENIESKHTISVKEYDSDEMEYEDSTEKFHRKKYICSKEGCTLSFRTAFHLRRHIQEHEAFSPNVDPLDVKPMSLLESPYSVDQPKANPEQPSIQQDFCNVTQSPQNINAKNVSKYPDLTELQEVTKKVANRFYYCPQQRCTRRFARLQHLQQHQVVHEKSSKRIYRKKYVCPECLRAFSASSDLLRHQKVHDSTAKKIAYSQNVCQHEGCNKRFTETASLRRHQFVHINGDRQSFQYVCQHDGCSKSFQEISKLQRHQLVCGVKRVVHRKYICPDCSKGFASHWHLLRHQVVHDRTAKLMVYRKNTCPQEGCNKSFSDASNLRRHLLMHSNNDQSVEPKKYICPECSKGFPSASKLLRHKAVHDSSEARQAHKCSQCSKRFSSSNQLLRHQKVHDMEPRKVHKCPQCSKGFPSSYHLVRHQKVHDNAARQIARNYVQNNDIQMISPEVSTLQPPLDGHKYVSKGPQPVTILSTIDTNQTSNQNGEDGGSDTSIIVKVEQIEMEPSADEVTIDEKSDLFAYLPYDEACELLQQWEIYSQQETDSNAHFDSTE